MEINGKGIQPISIQKNITLLTWNIGYGGLGKEMDFFYEGGKLVRPTEEMNAKYLKGISDFLEKESYRDIILLQEVDFDSKRSYQQNELAAIKENLPAHVVTKAINYQSKFVPVPFFEPMGKVKSGLVTFSRYQPEQSERLASPVSYGWPKRLFQLKRGFLVNRIAVSNGKELVLINLHNSAFDDADELRDAELGMLGDLAMKEYANGNYVIAGGDWNQSPPGMNRSDISRYKAKTVRPLDKDLFPVDWIWAWDKHLPTNRDVDTPFDVTSSKTSILDYFLLSPNIELVDVQTFDLHFENSDHLPVGMTVRLN